MANVVLDGITKTYPGPVVAVQPCDLVIPDGQFTVLVGPSGCGKSTTLRMIAGLESITGGTVRIGDRIVNDVPPKDRNVAMVFQNYALYPHLSVDRNLRFPLERRRETSAWKSLVSTSERAAREAESTAIDARVDDVAKQLEIDEYRHRFPRELSGGQRQRVALGRALVRDPEVFLLDEPLSNLDARLRLAMRSELRLLHQRLGATMIHVTHDQEEAMTLGDVLVVMHDGVIHQVGSPDEIYDRPVDRFVASFIGTPPMNFIDGAVSNGVFTCEDGETIPVPGLSHEGSAVLGIRPEAIGFGQGAIRGVVETVERLGYRMDVVMTGLGGTMTARVSVSDPIAAGEVCSFEVSHVGVHVFEPGDVGARVS